MDNESVTVKVSISLKDYLGFQWQHIGKILILTCLQLSFVTASIIRNGRTVGLPISVMLLIFVTGIIGTVLYFLLKMHFTGLYKSNKPLLQEQIFIVTPDVLDISTKTTTAEYAWHELYAFKETKDYFYIYIAKGQSYILPKNLLPNNEQILFVRCQLQQLPHYKGKEPFLTKAYNVFIFIFLLVGIFSYAIGSIA